MSCCLFILFSLMHFFLLNSFSRCFPSLGVLLLSSMSLGISASLVDKSSLTFAAADAITRASLLSFLISLALLLAGMEHDRTCLFILLRKLVHQDVLLNCVQDDHHLVGVVSAIAPLPARRSRRCGHFYHTCRVKTSNCLDICARSELIFPVVLSSYCCSSCFILRLLVLLLRLHFSIECGRCSCNRSPAVLSHSLSFLMSSLTQGLDVQPS